MIKATAYSVGVKLCNKAKTEEKNTRSHMPNYKWFPVGHGTSFFSFSIFLLSFKFLNKIFEKVIFTWLNI